VIPDLRPRALGAPGGGLKLPVPAETHAGVAGAMASTDPILTMGLRMNPVLGPLSSVVDALAWLAGW
jgi:hypothetical protein